jgi:exodeoxyribonuclease V alpha subunit
MTISEISSTQTTSTVVKAQLAPWVAAGVISEADRAVTAHLCSLTDERLATVSLALALALRGPSHGHVAVDPERIRSQVLTQIEHQGRSDLGAVTALDWPVDSSAWLDEVAASGLCPELLHVERGLIYLRRSADHERKVADWFLTRATSPMAATTELSSPNLDEITATLALTEEQHSAVVGALGSRVSVLTGGPGMGKTTTVAALLAALTDQQRDHPLRIALAAPTGKAAARLAESINTAAARLADANPAGRGRQLAETLASAQPSTIHSLLGSNRGGTFRHHRDHPLPFDVVIVDETSMVSLELMSALLDSIGETTQLTLVGDAHQLPSIDAGSVLGDLATAARLPSSPLAGLVHELTVSFRFPPSSQLGLLAAAVNAGDPDVAWSLLSDPTPHKPGTGLDADLEAGLDAGFEAIRVSFTDDLAIVSDAVTANAKAVRAAADAGDGDGALSTIESKRVMCAHNHGPTGVHHWNELAEAVTSEATTGEGWWHPGRPVMVTANNRTLHLVNGDQGVVVNDESGQRKVVFRSEHNSVRYLAPTQLPNVTTMHAITIHKSQGSEFDEVIVVLPPADSLLATRQLLYTAITRARKTLRIVGTEASLRASVVNDTERHSGLLSRLSEPR